MTEDRFDKKPVIGILPLVDTEKESYWMLPGYMEGIEAAGGIPVMLALTEDESTIKQLADSFDGFLFTGGHDVSPGLYGEEKLAECAECSIARDNFERTLFKYVLEADKPVLGICRGIQLINVLLGGSLYQDIPTQYLTETKHHMAPPYNRTVHEVNIIEKTPLFDLIKCSVLGVNSYHHQAIKKLADELKPMAISEDGLIEAVYMPQKRFVMAVQWHPEFSFKTDRYSAMIFDAFVKSMK